MLKLVITGLSLVAATASSAATLLTTQGTYRKPVINVGAAYAHQYNFASGPLALGNGVTFSSSGPSVLGRDNRVGTGGYVLGGNGAIVNATIIGTNVNGMIKLTFANPVRAFGSGFNYITPLDGGAPFQPHPTISAYDMRGGLIARYDLVTSAPIATPGAIDAFAFRGIDAGAAIIKTFALSGYGIVMSAISIGSPTPEPATWVLMIGGFGLVGLALRRRTLAQAG